MLALAFCAALAVPAVASAAGYVPDGNVSVSGGGSVAAGGAASVTFAPGSFAGDASANVQVTGESGFTLGAIVVKTKSYPVANGGFAMVVNIPAEAPAGATYTVTATGASSGTVATAALSVAGADSADPSRGLAFTGGSVPVLLVWGGIGVLILGAALLVVFRIVRRQRSNA